MVIWETIKENWFEILAAVSTIASIFMTRGNKRTKAERQEIKAKKLETKAAKDLDKAKAKYEKAAQLKKGD